MVINNHDYMMVIIYFMAQTTTFGLRVKGGAMNN